MRVAAWTVLLFGSVLFGQPSPDSRPALFMRVGDKVRLALGHIPNYTCTEQLTRRTFHGQPPKLARMDRVRLEVAVVDGEEMYSWPGASFEKSDPSDVVGGSITSGEYASLLAIVFDASAASYTAGEDEMLSGRRVVRFDYRVREPKYMLRSGLSRVKLPFHGSFWVDPGTEQVLALQISLDAIPRTVDMDEISNLIEYGRVRLDAVEYSFPTAAEVTAKYRGGQSEIRNRIAFSDCRRYMGESKITFGESDAPVAGAVKAGGEAAVPGGIDLHLALESPVSIAAAAGDPVVAKLTKQIRTGDLFIPEGTRVTGRVLRCELVYTVAPPRADIVFDLSTLELGDKRLKFRGRMKAFTRMPGLSDTASSKMIGARELRSLRTFDWGRGASFLLTGYASEIPAGFRMTWETERPGR